MFHNSSARFSLIDKPVCYIAPDIITAMIETTPEFRKEQNVDLLREKIKQWLDGNYNPDKSKMGYPKNNISIREGANILDLRDNDPCVCRFYNLFEKYELSISSNRFYKEIVHKKNPKSYEIIRALAEFAHENGFNGIRYKSTHAIDNNKNNDIIVIFDSKFIEEK